jgi:hypothetical protein
MSIFDRLEALTDAWRRRVVPLPIFVQSLDQLVSDASDLISAEDARRARRTWGQIEIINALTLDAGSALDDADRADIDDLLVELSRILRTGEERLGS